MMLTRTTKRLSQALFWVTILLMGALAASFIWLLAEPSKAMVMYTQTLDWDATISDQAFRALGLAWFVSVGLGAILLGNMAALFRAFADDQPLGDRLLRHVKGAGQCLLAIVVYRLILRPLEGLILALWPVADGRDSITVSFSVQDVTLALGGALLLMLGRVLVEARRAAEENQAFV